MAGAYVKPDVTMVTWEVGVRELMTSYLLDEQTISIMGREGFNTFATLDTLDEEDLTEFNHLGFSIQQK